MKIWTREWFWHGCFWLTYLLLRLFVIQLYPGTPEHRLTVELIELPLKIVTLYVLIYIVVLTYLKRRKYFMAMLSLTVSTFMVMWLNRFEDYYLIYPMTKHAYVNYVAGVWVWKTAFVNLIYIYPVVGLGMALYFIKSWIENQITNERLAREKAEIELKSLRDQIQPHFLFNTLNNIYSLALDQSSKTPEMILRLSKLMEFMTYHVHRDHITLAEEIEAIQSYIALEKLRLGKRLELSFTAEGPVTSTNIAPLLLFPLVENCFKHGSHQTHDTVWITVHITITNEVIIAQLENSIPQKHGPRRLSSGVGLQNIRKRLSILYPSHELRIHQEETFLVRLSIPIA